MSETDNQRAELSAIGDTFKRHWRLVVLVVSIGLVVWIVYLLINILLPFIFGLVVAYLLLPLISWAEKTLPYPRGWKGKRICLIILTFVVIFGLAGIFGYYMANTVVSAFLRIIQNAPSFFSWGLFKFRELFEGMRQVLPPELLYEWDTFLIDAGEDMGRRIRDVVLRGVSLAPAAFGTLLGFGVLPIFLYYVLKDSKQLSKGFYSGFPLWIVEHVRNIVHIIERVIGRYIRAQLLLGFIVGYATFTGLVILGIGYAPALAAFAGLMELVPIIGPWVAGAAAVIVTLAIAPDKAIWVAVLALGIQFMENNFLVPRIQGAYLKFNPAVAIVILVASGYIWGFWGILLSLPLTATFVEIYKYLRGQVEQGKL